MSEPVDIFSLPGLELLILGLVITSVFGFVYVIGLAAVDITYITLADGSQQKRQLPITFRVLMPWVKKMDWLTKRTRPAVRKKLQQDLVTAGYDALLTPEDMVGFKWLSPFTVGAFLGVLMAVVFHNIPGPIGAAMKERLPIIILLMMLFLYMSPIMWLRGIIKKRHKSIERALPFVLDLLTLSVEAGLDLMTALKRIIERRVMDPLGEELMRVFREIQIGKTRREALKALSDRVNHADIRTLVGAMSQADELGVSMGTILRVQSEQMRVRRFQRAEKLANQAPVKMLFPLVLFIFPAVFMVMLGPIFIDMMNKGF